MIPTFYQAGGRGRETEAEEFERLWDEFGMDELVKANSLERDGRTPNNTKDAPRPDHYHADGVAGGVGRDAAIIAEGAPVNADGGSTLGDKKSERAEHKKSESSDLGAVKVPGNTRRSCGRRRRPLARTTSDALVPRPWSRQIDEHRIIIHQLALDAAGQSFRFTVRFKDDVIVGAMNARKTLSTWANERLSYYLEPLEEKLGRELLFWFTVEGAAAGDPHVHGAIDIDAEHLGDLEQALQRFSGGTYSGAGRWFVHVEPFDDAKEWNGLKGSLGWARYASKRFRRKLIDPRLGSQLVCRRSLNRRSQVIWEEIREEGRRHNDA